MSLSHPAITSTHSAPSADRYKQGTTGLLHTTAAPTTTRLQQTAPDSVANFTL